MIMSSRATAGSLSFVIYSGVKMEIDDIKKPATREELKRLSDLLLSVQRDQAALREGFHDLIALIREITKPCDK